VTDRSTMKDHIDDLLEEVSRLYNRIHRLEAQLEHANKRAEYWAKMYDELSDIANETLNDDEEIDPDGD
jgi:cell division septum initiation protein DivIVA